jgi:hypothetical protein
MTQYPCTICKKTTEPGFTKIHEGMFFKLCEECHEEEEILRKTMNELKSVFGELPPEDEEVLCIASCYTGEDPCVIKSVPKQGFASFSRVKGWKWIGPFQVHFISHWKFKEKMKEDIEEIHQGIFKQKRYEYFH